MPYSDKTSFETASYTPLRRIVDNKKIEQQLKKWKVKRNETIKEQKIEIVNINQLEQNYWQPDMVVAIDGSKHEVPVENGFPSAEYGYVTVASVLIKLDKIRELEKNEFIDPVAFRKTEEASTTETAFPGCNIVIGNEDSAKSSMRRALYEELLLSDSPFYAPDEKLKESFLETYEYLLKIKRDKSPDTRPPKCPIEDCDNDFSYGFEVYDCKCERKKNLFSSDALRLHELHNDGGGCGEMYGQIMFTLERLWLIHILRGFEKQNLLKSLKNLAFIIDGSLAVFSTPSWLAKPIEVELRRINELQKKENGQDLIILGIEKSGQFVNHFVALDTDREGITGKIPNQSAILLNDNYIKKNIKLSDSPKPYGQDTYFGRKFFYKTNNGYRVTANIAVFSDYQKDLETAYPNQFPRLADVMNLLDQVVSSRFENSVSPLLSAHAEASIPLNLGKRIFQEIAREIRNRS